MSHAGHPALAETSIFPANKTKAHALIKTDRSIPIDE